MLCYLPSFACYIHNDTSYQTIKHQRRKQKLENLFLLILLSCFVVARYLCRSRKKWRSRNDMKSRERKKFEWITIYIFNDSKNKRIILYDNTMRVSGGEACRLFVFLVEKFVARCRVEENQQDPEIEASNEAYFSRRLTSLRWDGKRLVYSHLHPRNDLKQKDSSGDGFWTRTTYGDSERKWKAIQYMTNLWGKPPHISERKDVLIFIWRADIARAYFTDMDFEWQMRAAKPGWRLKGCQVSIWCPSRQDIFPLSPLPAKKGIYIWYPKSDHDENKSWAAGCYGKRLFKY